MLKSQTDKKRIALIGAGISGLSCLYFYLKNNPKNIQSIDIFEKNDQIGGVLIKTQKDHFLLEHGAQGVLSNRTNFTCLVEELKLDTKISAVQSNKAHRHLFFKNKIICLSPRNIFLMIRTNLISIFTVFRIISEVFVRSTSNSNETVAEFFIRRFGKKFTHHFLMPVMKGIWGGGAARILMRFAFPQLQQIEKTSGSVIKYFFKQKRSKSVTKKELLSFDKGMGYLPHVLFGKIQEICLEQKIHLNVYLNSSFELLKTHQYDKIIYSGHPWREKNYESIDALCDALMVNNKIEQNKEKIHDAWNVIAGIPTHSLYVVGIGDKSNTVQNKLDGFGALAVEENTEGVLGVICVHSLNPNHVPNEGFLYRVILGGENLPKNLNFETCSDNEIISCAKKYLQKYHLLETNRIYEFEHVVRHPYYLPLLTQYHNSVLQAVTDLEHLIPGLYFVGNYLLGPAVDSCIEYSKSCACKM